jgi:hypothetical protein
MSSLPHYAALVAPAMVIGSLSALQLLSAIESRIASSSRDSVIEMERELRFTLAKIEEWHRVEGARDFLQAGIEGDQESIQAKQAQLAQLHQCGLQQNQQLSEQEQEQFTSAVAQGEADLQQLHRHMAELGTDCSLKSGEELQLRYELLRDAKLYSHQDLQPLLQTVMQQQAILAQQHAELLALLQREQLAAAAMAADVQNQMLQRELQRIRDEVAQHPRQVAVLELHATQLQNENRRLRWQLQLQQWRMERLEQEKEQEWQEAADEQVEYGETMRELDEVYELLDDKKLETSYLKNQLMHEQQRNVEQQRENLQLHDQLQLAQQKVLEQAKTIELLTASRARYLLYWTQTDDVVVQMEEELEAAQAEGLEREALLVQIQRIRDEVVQRLAAITRAHNAAEHRAAQAQNAERLARLQLELVHQNQIHPAAHAPLHRPAIRV